MDNESSSLVALVISSIEYITFYRHINLEAIYLSIYLSRGPISKKIFDYEYWVD